jgi:hypothetical protein
MESVKPRQLPCPLSWKGGLREGRPQSTVRVNLASGKEWGRGQTRTKCTRACMRARSHNSLQPSAPVKKRQQHVGAGITAPKKICSRT